MSALADLLIDGGVELDERLGLPDWDGGRLDLQQALDGLLWIGRGAEA